MDRTAHYTGTYHTAEGTRPATGYRFRSLTEAKHTMRQIALGNCLAGSTCEWEVWDSGADCGYDSKVASGRVSRR